MATEGPRRGLGRLAGVGKRGPERRVKCSELQSLCCFSHSGKVKRPSEVEREAEMKIGSMLGSGSVQEPLLNPDTSLMSVTPSVSSSLSTWPDSVGSLTFVSSSSSTSSNASPQPLVYDEGSGSLVHGNNISNTNNDNNNNNISSIIISISDMIGVTYDDICNILTIHTYPMNKVRIE